MKSKQLANVLIKILGLSVCLHAIPSCISGILYGVVHLEDTPHWLAIIPMVSYDIGAVIQEAVGLVMIIQSQKVASWMFKTEDE